MTDKYIPYETVARAEAEDIVVDGRIADALGLHPSRIWVLKEILAAVHAQGMDMGFALSNFGDEDPMDVIEAYNAGVADALEKGC